MTPVSAELSRLLFGPDRDRVHGPWQELAADPAMHRRPEAPVADQLAASYDRLKHLNARADPAALAGDPRLLPALHEWTAVADGGLTVLAGIHYNLFLGTLLDHDHSPKRPLDDYLRMDRIGTINGITSYAADIEGAITAEGDNMALWAKAAAELLLESESSAPAAVAGGLDDPAVRQGLLQAAVRLRAARARTRLREAPAGDSLRRWNAAAPDALAAVTAHAEHDAAAALLAWADSARDDTARALLHDLHRLFTLRRIEAHGTLLLGAGELAPDQAEQLPELRERSFERPADHALALVDAFDLPQAFHDLRPITGPDYQEAFLRSA